MPDSTTEIIVRSFSGRDEVGALQNLFTEMEALYAQSAGNPETAAEATRRATLLNNELTRMGLLPGLKITDIDGDGKLEFNEKEAQSKDEITDVDGDHLIEVGGQLVEQKVEKATSESGSGNGERSEGREASTEPEAKDDARGGAQFSVHDATIRDGKYHGEDIRLDVEPKNHVVEQGETLDSIARAQLGSGASETDVQKYIKEIRTTNNIAENEEVKECDQISLPGHDSAKAGGADIILLNEKTGYREFFYRDGSTQYERDDQRSVRVLSEKPEKWYFGPESADQFTIAENADGTKSVFEGDSETALNYIESGRVKQAREHLMTKAREKITDPVELGRFEADVARFEDRLQKEGIFVGQAAATYGQVERLLSGQGNQPFSERQRVQLAEQVMAQAANPTLIAQGGHPTCNVTVVESRLYSRQPAAAAGLVADVALTGQYTARDGTKVNLPPESLRPDTEARNWPLLEDGDRSHATQLFNMTAVNLYYARHSPHVRYESHTDPQNPEHTEDRLMDYSRRPPRKLSDSPELTDQQITEVHNRVLGAGEKGFYIGHQGYANADDFVKTFTNEEQFQTILETAKREGRFPLILKVNTASDPFWTDGNGGEGGAHVVTVKDYVAGPPPAVMVDNQWEMRDDYTTADTAIPLHDLYVSTLGSHDAAVTYRREAEAAKTANGFVELDQELELLRFQRKARHISGDVYTQQIVSAINEADSRWKANPPTEEERRAKIDELIKVMDSMPPQGRAAVMSELNRLGWLPDDEFDRELSYGLKTAVERKAELKKERTFGPINQQAHLEAMKEYASLLSSLPQDRQIAILDTMEDGHFKAVMKELPPSVVQSLTPLLRQRTRLATK